MASKHTITVFLDQDGYTAYFNKFSWISAGGNTEEEAIKELGLAFKAAKKSFPDSDKYADLILAPVAAHY